MAETAPEKIKSIGKWISVIYRKSQIEINKTLKPYGLISSHFIFLIQLYKGDRVSQDYLSKALYIDKSATARAIKQLEASGYVIRKVNAEDKRSNYVCLTEKALSMRDEFQTILFSWNERLTRGLNGEEYDFIYKLLRQMAGDILENGEPE